MAREKFAMNEFMFANVAPTPELNAASESTSLAASGTSVEPVLTTTGDGVEVGGEIRRLRHQCGDPVALSSQDRYRTRCLAEERLDLLLARGHQRRRVGSRAHRPVEVGVVVRRAGQ